MKVEKYVMKPRIFIKHTKHWSFIGQDAIEMLPGELWLFTHWGRNPTDFNAGSRKEGNPFVILKSKDGGRSWSEEVPDPIPWAVDGYRSDGGVSVLKLISGTIVFISHRHGDAYGYSGSHGVPIVSISKDNGKSWSEARIMHEMEDAIYVMNQRLIQMSSGRLVLPISYRDPKVAHADYAEGAMPTVGRCYISDDEGVNWRLSEGTVVHNTQRGVQEPCIAETGESKLVMIFRSGTGSHQICRSCDGGETWSKPESTSLKAACSPLTLTKLPDRRLILVYNPGEPLFTESYYPRNPLAYALSNDEGRTWSEPVIIDAQPGQQLIYPSITLTPDGLLIIYCACYDHGDGSFHFPSDAYLVGGGKASLIGYPL